MGREFILERKAYVTTPDPRLLLASETYTPFWVPDLDEDTYHADKTALNSSSGKHALVSAALFKQEFWFPNNKETAAKRLGKFTHAALLEEERFRRSLAIIPEFSGTGMKAAKQKWQETYKDAIQIDQEELDLVDGMIASIKKHSVMNLLGICQKELSGYYRDPQTSLRCRIRVDAYSPQLDTLLDFKTTDDASVESFTYDADKYNYALQLAMYRAGIEIIEGRPVKRCLILTVSKKPPHPVVLYEATDNFLASGAIDYRKYLQVVRNGIDLNHWENGQTSGTTPLGLTFKKMREGQWETN